jgi:predicted enzyme related to lactoylglutathione lyase
MPRGNDGVSKNPIVHFEIGCTSVAETKEFLLGLFDWEMGSDETSAAINTRSRGGLSGHLAKLGEEWGHYVTIYVQVDNLEYSVARTLELGGKVLVEPVVVKGQGRFAWIAPPEGQIIGLWEGK